MEQNFYQCPICGRLTRHIEVKLAEVAAVSGGGLIVRSVAGGLDAIGGKLIKAAIGFNFWKCGECGSITSRDAAGEVADVLKVGTPNHVLKKAKEEEPFYITQNTLNNYTVINVNNITNIYVNEQLNSQPDWVHKTDGFRGKMLDSYDICFHAWNENDKKDLIVFLMNILGEKKEKLLWELREQPYDYYIRDLTYDRTYDIWTKAKNSRWIDFMEIR